MTIRAALLQLLDERECHGYQLKVEFESRTGGLWPLNVGQVYTTLDRLVRDGMVAEDGTADAKQRTYRITEDGRGEVKAWLTASTAEATPPRDELIMKVLLAVGRGPDEAVQVIDDQRSTLLAVLQMGRRRQRSIADPASAEALAQDARLSRIEADIRWLDRCEERLRATTTEGTR